MKPIILLIAYYFPPDNAIGGARPFRFYKYLKRLGYECHVFTAAGLEGKGIAPDVHYIPDPLKLRPRQGLAWQAERVSWKFLLRGMHVLGWSQAAFKASQEFISQRKGERLIIISSSPPLGTHIAAWRLAKKFRIHWIADFRDPIHNAGSGDRALLESIIAPRLEQKILRTASAVLANTDAMRNHWVANDGSLSEKTHVLWNGFDAEDVISLTPVPTRMLKIWSHVGELYEGRDIRPILFAVDRLRNSGRLPSDQLKLVQVGYTEPECLPGETFINEATKQGWLELRKSIPAAEARNLALDSDGLLLIQPQTAIQVPGKLFDYLRLGRPIFAYVVRNSPVEHILQRAGIPYECIYPESTPREIEDRLVAFWEGLSSQIFSPNSWFDSTFEASRQAEVLARIIIDTVGIS
jgi:hypothetical protein